MTAKEAREYIARYHLIAGMPGPMRFAEKGGKRYAVEAMTDEDIISLALSCQREEAMVAQEALKHGATVN